MSKRMVDLKVEDGKITSINGYEVGGGGLGSLGVSVIKFEPKTKSPTNQLLSWKKDDGFQELKPNTAYEVGDSFVLEYQHVISETLEKNQIMSPVDVYIAPTQSQINLTYGGVILSCGSVQTSTYYTNTSADKPTITVSHKITYTVVKIGTKGANVNPPNPQTFISYIIYTLGVTQASQ